MGLYVITCDYIPSNPGHQYANEYVNISTTDLEGVLAVAREKSVDSILAYASEPAAPTAAFVAEKLGLPGNPYKSVLNLYRKDFFRKLQQHNSVNHPAFSIVESPEDVLNFLNHSKSGRILLKPVDSSGSKGITMVTLPGEAIASYYYAQEFSRSRYVIAEDFIPKKGYQVGGDGFVINGELVFSCLGDLHFNAAINPLLPCALSMPTTQPATVTARINEALQNLITLSGFRTGAFNIDVIVDQDEDVFVIEIGPRCGGNMIPQLIERSTGVRMVDYILKAAIGEPVEAPEMNAPVTAVSHIVLYSNRSGNIKELKISKELESKIFFSNFNFSTGSHINRSVNTNDRLGILLAEYLDQSDALTVIGNLEHHITLEVEETRPWVTIRPLVEEDAYISWQWRNNPKVWENTVNRPPFKITPETELEWIRKVLKEDNSRRFAILVDGVYSGNVQLTEIAGKESYAGIFLGEENTWRNGIGTAALRLILNYAREELGLERIRGRVRKTHFSSYRMLRKLGALEDHIDDQFIHVYINLRKEIPID